MSVFEACDLNIYAHYQLDITVTIEDSNVPGGKIVLTTASSRFAMKQIPCGRGPNSVASQSRRNRMARPGPLHG